MPKEKIIIGIAAYGRGWRLDQATDGIPSEKGGSVPFPPKQHTETEGIASYYEICDIVASGGIRKFDDQQKVPYVIKNGTEWWGYDDVESVSNKVGKKQNSSITIFQMKWLISEGYGGAFAWSLHYDDFNGRSSNGVKFPLISVMSKLLAPRVRQFFNITAFERDQNKKFTNFVFMKFSFTIIRCHQCST